MSLVTRVPWLAGPAAYGVHIGRGAYVDALHIRILSDAFRRCALTPAGRLMIIAPPRHGKSSLASHAGPAWYISLFPERRVLFGSFAADFASSWGEKVRNSVQEYGGPLGIQLGGRKAREFWNTNHGGGMRTVGVGGGVAGQGGHLLVMDDTVASMQEALSKTVQDSTWQWWMADFSTRKDDPSASIVAIGTRWSERDLLGRLISAYEEGPGAEGYENWEILYLPAIYDAFDWTGRRPYEDPMGRQIGEALWDKWPLEFLERERAAKPWQFAALFQGRPQPLEGGLFKQNMWNYWAVETEDVA